MAEVLIENAEEEHISTKTEEVSDSMPPENTPIRNEEQQNPNEPEEVSDSIPRENTPIGNEENLERASSVLEERSASNPQQNSVHEIGESFRIIIAQEITSNDTQEISDSKEGHTCIEMKEMIDYVKRMLQNGALHSRISGGCSIHKVSEEFHNMTQPSKYRPRAISMGPFHYRDQSFRANEELKLQFAHRLLDRTAKEKQKEWFTIFEECFTSIKTRETEVRGCYSETIDLKSEEFVKMMVIDGLFLIELFLQIGRKKAPFHSNLSLENRVTKDLFLLENQIPLIVLKCLYNIIALPTYAMLTGLVFYFTRLYAMKLVPNGIPEISKYENAKHLLDFLGMKLTPTSHILLEEMSFEGLEWADFVPSSDPSIIEPEESYNKIPSAAELHRAGVRFKKGSPDHSFMAIKFSRKGIFKMPPTYLYCGTDTIFRNLIACEQSYSKRYGMTSYANLMDALINSAEDVAVLRKAGILKSYLGSDEDVCNLYNKLASNVTLKKNSYSELEEDVNEYYKKRWHTWKAMLRREYFKSPWAIISVIAAALLILLTIISTVFGVLQVVLPKN